MLHNLKPCPKADPGTNLEPVKSIIDNAVLDIDLVAVHGLASKNKLIYNKATDIKHSLENAQTNLRENMYKDLSEEEQMRIIK